MKGRHTGGSADEELMIAEVGGASEGVQLTMLELSFTQKVDVKVVRETQRVEANVTSQGAVQLGGAFQERD